MPNDKLYIDFASAANTFRRLRGGGNGQPIAKAVGLKTYGLPLTIIDATAGLGQDAFVLASLGCNVLMIERSPIVAALLADALERGKNNLDIAEIIARMRLIAGDAYTVLQALPEHDLPDVVYLDPMFPERSKSALVKQDIRALKDIVGDDPDADSLLEVARKAAKRRIVVKRPRVAPYLGLVKPHASQIGQANRFDVYMPASKV